MVIHFHSRFKKQLKKAPESIRRAFYKHLTLFQDDPFQPALGNHAITGKYLGCRSIDISGDWRAVYQLLDDNECVFAFLGTHSQLYG